MIKKILCILTVVSLLGVFCVTSFAQSFSGDFGQIANDKRLWSPERISYLETYPDGTTTTIGTLFEVSPRYAINENALPQTTYVNITGVDNNINDIVPSWLRYIYHNTRYNENTFNRLGQTYTTKDYIQTIYLSRRGNAQTNNMVYLQADFPRFFVDLSVYDATPIDDNVISIRNVPTNGAYPFGFRVTYAIDNGVGVEFKTLSYSETVNGNSYTFSLETIISKIREKMDADGDSFYYYGKNRILINALSISAYSIDGYVIVTQNREAGVRMVGTETLSTDKVTPNFLNSMASVITDFFATTLFQVGSYEVTLGVVFALPFVICILFVFLRKFAGG